LVSFRRLFFLVLSMVVHNASRSRNEESPPIMTSLYVPDGGVRRERLPRSKLSLLTEASPFSKKKSVSFSSIHPRPSSGFSSILTSRLSFASLLQPRHGHNSHIPNSLHAEAHSLSRRRRFFSLASRYFSENASLSPAMS